MSTMAMARILLVEDSRSQAQVTKEFLERAGYEVLWVMDGTSAIKTVKTTPIDVILLDLILPDINGKEVCRWLKLNTDTKGIPIIMLTVQGSLEDKVAGLEAGADDYLQKPYDDIELNARIYAALRTKALQDELREKNKQMEELLARVELLAITDPLTELYNRRRLEAVLEIEWRKVKRYGYPLSCLMIDIDYFKSINDRYGHKTGDLVIREIGQLIKGTLREVDTVARWGGEEFFAVLPQTDRQNAQRAGDRILERISGFRLDQLPAVHITVSIGVSYSGPATDTSEKLVNAADFALYEAKKNGRNRVEVAPDDFHEKPLS